MNLTNKNVIHKNNGIEYLQFRKLLEFPEIKHAYVIGLDKSFKIYTDDGHKKENEAAKKSYKKICNELDIEYKNLVNTMQNHTDNIKIVKKVSITLTINITTLPTKNRKIGGKTTSAYYHFLC